MEAYKAGDVLKAARKTYEQYGSGDYPKGKANSFLKRCGADIELGPGQEIPKESIDRIVFAMLDEGAGKVFWRNLRGTE